jgi:AraC family transcriptional regulator
MNDRSAAGMPFDIDSCAQRICPDGVHVEYVGPESVRLSSRALGWPHLNYERREIEPSWRDFPEGTTEHVVYIMLSSGMLERESAEGRTRHQLAPGFVALAPSQCPVRWSWSSRISFSLLSLQPDFLRYVAERKFGMRADQVNLTFAERVQDPVLSDIAATLARETVRADAGSRVYAESMAHILAVHLLRNYLLDASTMEHPGAPVSVPRAVRRAVAFIQQSHARDIGLEDIAAASHMSPFHLVRLFKRSLGVTPRQHLIRTRVENARALITAGGGGYSLSEIALAVGFADQSHLTRHFKRLLGVTPRQIVVRS